MVAEFARALEDGNYFVTVCNALGIDESAAYDWLNKGKAGEDACGDWPEAYREFAKSVKAAGAKAEMNAVQLVMDAARPQDYALTEKGTAYPVVLCDDGPNKIPGQWQAAMTFLERRFGDRWKRTERQEQTGPNGGPVQTQVVGVADVLANDNTIELACQMAEQLASGGSPDPGDAGTGT